MKKTFKFGLTLALSCLFVGTSYGATTQMFAFGDSYSDNGQAKEVTKAIVADENKPEAAYEKPSDELYWEGRYSNGNTAVEVFAQKLKTPLTNYATGGATSGEGNYSDWMDHLGGTGVLGQVSKFEASLKGEKADPEALYFIFVSANDYFKFVDYAMPGTVEAVADEAVDNIKMAVRRLSKLGAKNFFVVNSSDLALVPYEITEKRTELATTFKENVNAKLPAALEELEKVSDVNVQIFDLPTVSSRIVKDPRQYGLVNLVDACQPTYPEVKKADSNADGYYFWDEWHYSKKIHSLIGEAMYDAYTLEQAEQAKLVEQQK